MNQKKGLVVITGASSGIGAAIAKRFSENGYPLLLIARRLEKIESLNLENSLCRKVDITDTKQFKEAIAEAEALYGNVDCLINNAGVMLLGSLDTQDPEEWTKMFNVNVLGLMSSMQSVLSNMKSRQTGTIINISSVAGKKSYPDHAAYSATKFAVSGLTESVREEVAGDGVRVMSICPGAVETELLSHTTSDDIKNGYQEWKEDIGGAINSDDIARTVLFMHSQPQNVNIREVIIAPTKQQA